MEEEQNNFAVKTEEEPEDSSDDSNTNSPSEGEQEGTKTKTKEESPPENFNKNSATKTNKKRPKQQKTKIRLRPIQIHNPHLHSINTSDNWRNSLYHLEKLKKKKKKKGNIIQISKKAQIALKKAQLYYHNKENQRAKAYLKPII